MSCPFKYHPKEIYYKTSQGKIDANKIWTTTHMTGDIRFTYSDDQGNPAIQETRENKNITLCKINDFDCVGEERCPIIKNSY